jgi:hypothetical protein
VLNMQKMSRCPTSGLLLPSNFIDEKRSLKKALEEVVEKAINSIGHVRETYFLAIHAMFDREDSSLFKVSAPKATVKMPSFRSNTLVFWVSPGKGICELLWMVAPKKKGEKLQVEFNQEGVAYLQAKQAMPKPT